MLPNHPTLVVAEQFAMLEALHPGRIDLGIGRAPGADPMTAAALRRTVEGLGADDFPAEVIDVLALLGQDLPGRAPSLRASRLSATPVATSSPQVWLLGSSTFSAELAGSLGLPFSYAHHFNTGHTLQAADAYRRAFRPSPVLDAPRLMVSASVLVADSDDEAHYLAGPSRVMALSLRTGRPLGPIVSPEDAARELAALDPVAAADFFARVPGTQVATTADRAVDELAALVGADGRRRADDHRHGVRRGDPGAHPGAGRGALAVGRGRRLTSCPAARSLGAGSERATPRRAPDRRPRWVRSVPR